MKLFVTIFVTLLLVSNNSFSQGNGVKIEHSKEGKKIVFGKASHYSENLNGTRTAIGTRYYNNKMTAASNFFKLRTWVLVTRISTGESIKVFINDRMHQSMAKKGRIIDLSIAATKVLGFMRLGITKVKVEEIPDSTQ